MSDEFKFFDENPLEDPFREVVGCPSCEGSGVVADPHHGHGFQCSRCDGTGKVEVPKPQSLARFACGLGMDDDDIS